MALIGLGAGHDQATFILSRSIVKPGAQAGRSCLAAGVHKLQLHQ